MKIAIAGKIQDTGNYVRYVRSMGALPAVTLDRDEILRCDGLVLPGGGDITPAFFGEKNHGSRGIDTELDILQLQAFDAAVRSSMPVLGICKGLQIINVGLGGTIIQDLDTAAAKRHRYDGHDQYHPTVIRAGSWLYKLYGGSTVVNSAHHQAIKRLGDGLSVIQRCPMDGCIEAAAHESLPVIGVQWHPERIDEEKAGIDGKKVLGYFMDMISGLSSSFTAFSQV